MQRDERSKKTQTSKKSLPKRVVLWDNDGPINNIRKISDNIGNLESLHKLPNGFFYEAEREKLKRSILIDNRNMLRATLEILAENNVESLIASQRITYGFAKAMLKQQLEAVLKGEPVEVLHPEKDADRLAVWNKLISGEVVALFADKDERTEVTNLLISIATGSADPKYLQPKETERLMEALNRLDDALKDEMMLSDEMYRAFDEAFGKDRQFLKKSVSQQIGEHIARQGKTDATATTKWMYVEAAGELFEDIRKALAMLVDDNEKYMRDEANFQQGNFVHAPRISNDPIIDNLYLGEVLIRNIPLDELEKSLKGYPDQAIANQLRALVVVALGRDLAADSTMTMDEKSKILIPLTRDFIKTNTKAGTEILQQLVDFCSRDQFKFLAADKGLTKNFMLMLISALGKNLDENTALDAKQKKSIMSNTVLTCIQAAKDNLIICDIIAELSRNDSRYNFLREESGILGFGILSKTSEKVKYGMTETWQNIVGGAKAQVLANVKQAKSVTVDEDKRIRELLSMDVSRAKGLRTSSYMTDELKEYETSLTKGEIQIQKSASLKQPQTV